MASIDAFIAWFSGRRTRFGAAFTSLGAILLGSAQFYPSKHLTAVGGIVTLIGSHLMTTGMFKSDDFHRDKLKLLETQIDRRNPESLIPVSDLKKLLDEEGKPLPIWTEEQRAAKRAELKAQGLREGPPTPSSHGSPGAGRGLARLSPPSVPSCLAPRSSTRQKPK